MQLELIENRGPNTLLSTMRGLLGRAKVFDAQAAFVSADGIGTLLPHLRRAASRGKVRIVTGLYQGVTEPSALRLLLTAQRQTKGRVETRLARNPRFHRKLYLVGHGKTYSVVSGSSNLTGDGLKSAGEFNLLVRLPVSQPSVRRLSSDFNWLWNTGAVPLSLDRIRRYERARPRRPRPAMSQQSIALILGSDSSNGTSGDGDPPDVSPRHWRDCIGGFVRGRTEAVVREETDWDERGYLWYSAVDAVFERGHNILLFDRTIGWAEVVQVRDTTRTATPTPDGRHFVAYERVPGWHRRHLNRNLWKRFADVGLAIDSAASVKRRRLTDGQWGRVASIFQK
jgi:HKD family nuclease